MNWHSWQDFLAMGGYGLYVWGAFGAVLLALVLEWWAIARQTRAALAEVRQVHAPQASQAPQAPQASKEASA